MSLTDDLRQLKEIVPAVAGSLLHEAVTDPDATVLALSVLCGRNKALSRALLTYFVMRQTGHYVLVLASKADRLAQVISDGRS